MKIILKGAAVVCLSMLASNAAYATDQFTELKRRLDALEKKMQAPPDRKDAKTGEVLEVNPADSAKSTGILDAVAFDGLFEVEGSYTKNKGSKATSDLKLRTFQLAMEAKVNPWIAAYGSLLYEQGENNDYQSGKNTLLVEEAFVRMQAEESPFFVEAGRYTQAYGDYTTGMVSDPYTLELGETKRDGSLRAGIEQDGFLASFTAFKSEVQKGGSNNIGSFVAAVSWGNEDDEPVRYGIGGSYINNMGGTDGLKEGYVDNDNTRSAVGYVGGWSAHAYAGLGAFGLRGEYLSAVKKFAEVDPGYVETAFLAGAKPSAWSVEANYDFGVPLSLAVRYEQSRDFVEHNKRRYGATIGWEMVEDVALSLEYERGEQGELPDNSVVTMQLAAEF